MKSKELRSIFLKFFEKNKHKVMKGSSVIPQGDNTILFTNAGMNQFKDIFLGLEKVDYDCATTSQRCIRAGGKHNDLSNVGFTERHLTEFEMLGNFSFGSYFKKEAIKYAWDFLTKEIFLDAEKLWVTVFKDDEEAFLIWKNEIGIKEERIIKLGEKDNFWQMGDVGPCGPCSEIYFDRGIKKEIDKNAKPGDDFSTRFIEIWNLVFMQFNRELDGKFSNLKRKGIDTGMGLERLAMVVQEKNSVFETDCFESIFKIIEKLTGIFYEKNENLKPAFRVVADHLRSSCCIISEGIFPSNEGRGYVLRKIIRRALLFAKKISENKFFSDIVYDFLNEKDSLYNDLAKDSQKIKEVLFEEEVKFETNLILGKKKFLEILENLKNKEIFPGKEAFRLYDTFGFPLEVTEVLAFEYGIKIDLNEYEECMNEQRERSRAEENFKGDLNFFSDVETDFIGYEKPYQEEAFIKEIFVNQKNKNELKAGEYGYLVLSKSKFYPKGGGQISDSGYITFNNLRADVLDVVKTNKAIAIGIKPVFDIEVGSKIIQIIDEKKRKLIECNHTATHILQAVLRKIFGDTVRQAGSYVGPDCLTFDCFFQKNLSSEEIFKIEKKINEIIVESYDVSYKNLSYEEAVKNGAMAFFTEKYDKENVRTVKISKKKEENEEILSLELCGGTHVKNTNELSFFVIKSISSVASGIKRFTALTNIEAINYILNLKKGALDISNFLKAPIDLNYENLLKKEIYFDELKKELKQSNLDHIKYKSIYLEKDFKSFSEDSLMKYGIFNFSKENEDINFFKNYLSNFTERNNGIFFIFKIKDNLVEITGEISKNCLITFKNDFKEIFDNFGFKGKINEKFIQGVFIKNNFSEKTFEKLLISIFKI